MILIHLILQGLSIAQGALSTLSTVLVYTNTEYEMIQKLSYKNAAFVYFV